MKVVVLGATGPVGKALIEELKTAKGVEKIRAVSRSSTKKVDGKVTHMRGDLLDRTSVDTLIKGMDVAYLTAGLIYSTAIWQKEWPVIMENILMACEEYKVKFVFFDNIYAYGKVDGAMTEETPLNPTSKKGEVRKQLQEMIMQKVKEKKLAAVIVKSADFYGPGAKLSLFYISNIESILKKQKPSWIGNPKTLHSFTYVPDAAKALVIAGMDKKANNQIWHVPTAKPLTGEEYMQLITREMHMPNKYFTVNKTVFRIFGLFTSPVKELVEMFYQFDSDYILRSEKFEKAFNFKPTPYKKGIKQTVSSFV